MAVEGRKGRPCAKALLVLFAAVALSPALGSFTVKMMGISEELEKALLHVLEATDLNYTEPDTNATYISSTVFNPMGMGHLYNLTNAFVDLIQKKQAYPEGLLEVHGGHIELAGDLAEEWQTIATHYVGIVAVVVLAIIFAVLLPIIGFCFCCCRCAGNCGGRSQPFDKKHDKCRKRLLATFLICVVTCFMLGLVCTFVTNERIREGVYDLPNSAITGLQDTQKFLNVTHKHVNTLLTVNYQELKQNILNMIDTGGAKVSDQLGEFSRAVSVTTLNTMVKDLGKVKYNLINMRRVTNDLRTNASQLNDGLRSVKRELLHTLNNCSQRQCREIQEKYKIGELDTSGIDFSQLPDVSELLAKVTSLIDGNIQEEVMEGQKVFDNIKQSIESSVNKQIPKLKHAVEVAGKEIQQYSAKIDNFVINTHKAIVSVKPHLNEAEDYIQQYSIFGWYFGLTLCCVLLLILTCIVLGLLCGICGKRPDGYGDDCCNKGSGSKSLMCGVAFMFLLGSILVIMTLVYFLIGVVAQRAICDPLKNPKDDQLFALMDKMVNLEQVLFKEKAKKDFNMSMVVTACHQNKTIYDVLRLDKLVDIEALQKKSEKELIDKINEVHNSITFNQQNYVILKESAREKLRELSESGLSDFPFDRFTEVLVTNITSIDLTSLSKQLRDTANKISNKPNFGEVSRNLRNQALILETFQLNLVNSMITEAEMLNDTAIQLRDNLKFNHTSFKEAVLSLVDETKEAEMYLSVQGPEAIKNLTYTLAQSIGSRVSMYLSRVSYHTRKQVGHCGPLSNVYNATLTATCSRILLPFNGFWFAAACCILLFIPLIILSVKLATLYQKSDPYPGPLVEAKEDLKRNSSNIEDKIRDFEERRGKPVTVDVPKFKQSNEGVSKSPRTSFGRPIKFSFKSSYSSEFDSKVDDRTLPVGTKYSSKDECYTAHVQEDGKRKSQDSLKKKSRKSGSQEKENVARETAVCIIDSVLDSAKNIVETKLVDKGYKENLVNHKNKDSDGENEKNKHMNSELNEKIAKIVVKELSDKNLIAEAKKSQDDNSKN